VFRNITFQNTKNYKNYKDAGSNYGDAGRNVWNCCICLSI